LSESVTRARALDRPLPGLIHWWVHDERIDFRSDAYAVESDLGAVLIDPLPLTDSALVELGSVAAICITAGCHQRSAFSLRRRLAVPLWAPAGAARLDEAADVAFDSGASLPGGLQALLLPGPSNPHHIFLKRLGGDLAVFSGDMLITDGNGGLRPPSDEHHEDLAASRAGVRHLETLAPDFLCPAHGTVHRLIEGLKLAGE
jgi:glyoxylase-like metal-dependent hydrolase (beta-lactamase superfamily II)